MRRYAGFRRLVCLVLTFLLCLSFLGEAAQAKSSKKKKTVGTYTVTYPGGLKRKYKKYRQDVNYKKGSRYFRYYGDGASHNCVLTAVSIAASGFGVFHTPQAIHSGGITDVYSEKYALARLNLRYHPNQVHTLYLANQMLLDMGIPSRYVPVYSKSAAEAEIRAHLASGKPVIVLLKENRWHGVKLSHWRHAIVLVKANSKGKVTFINPNAGINKSYHGNKRRNIKLTVKQLLDHYMFSSKGNYAKAYNPNKAGGYILVG